MQSQVRFNRVPEKVLEKVWEPLVQPGEVQQGSGSGEGSRRRSGLGGFGAARSGSTGFWRRFQRLASQHASERFVTIKRCGCWGYHRSLFFFRQDIGVFEGKIIEAAQVLILITVVVVSFLSWIHSAPKSHG